jgi:hypothetical protein|nr:hypothetical protein MFMH1_47990 [Myxococcus sp. MH1]
MKLFAYVVRRDYGFAPNPFFGQCTLATCKPKIRKGAHVGDWIVGTGSTEYGLGGQLVYAMRVGETLTFENYWEDSRFCLKRPNMRGSIKHAFGDNIYHRSSPTEHWHQEKSHHSHSNGQTNRANIANDTQVNRVLVSDWFVYFGKDAIPIPDRFRRGKRETVARQGRGHLVNFRSGFETEFIEWVLSLGKCGIEGEPVEFRKHLARTGGSNELARRVRGRSRKNR